MVNRLTLWANQCRVIVMYGSGAAV